jgi:integrase
MHRVKLTKAVVDQAPLVAKGRATYYDTDLKGLALRVGQKSKVYYVCRWDAQANNTIWVKLGDAKHITPQIARTLAERELTRQRTADPDVATEPPVINLPVDEPLVRDDYTVEELVSMYLKEHAAKKRDGGREDSLKLTKYFLPYFPGRPAKSITRAEIAAILMKIKGRGMSDHVRAAISKMFNFGIGIAWVDTNPVVGTVRRHKKVKRDRVADKNELPILLNSLLRIEHPVLGKLIQFSLYTLARRSEVALAEWKEIDFAQKVWTIPKTRTKNGRRFLVPLSDPAMEILRSLFDAKKRWVFEYEKPTRKVKLGPPGVDYVSHYMKGHMDALRESDLTGAEGITVHDLRRTAATWIGSLMKRKDVPPILLNHTDSSATGHYDYGEYLDLKREALDLWAERLKGLLEGEPLSRGA